MSDYGTVRPREKVRRSTRRRHTYPHQTELDLLKTRARLRKVLKARRQLGYSSMSDSDEHRDGVKVTRNMQTQVAPYRRDVYCQVYPVPKVLCDIGVQTENVSNCVVEQILQAVPIMAATDLITSSSRISPMAMIEHNDEQMPLESPVVLTTATVHPNVPDYVREEVVVEEVDNSDQCTVVIETSQSYIDSNVHLAIPSTMHVDNVELGDDDKKQSDNVEAAVQVPAPQASSRSSKSPPGGGSYPLLPVFDNEANDNQLLKVIDFFLHSV
jgi:hypothetical protein